MNGRKLMPLLALLMTMGLAAPRAAAQDEKFDIHRFDVRGNTLLSADRVEALVKPFTGKGRVYGDVQKALEALENAYRAKGYGTVNVYVPEQEITAGVIRLDVTEARLGKVVVTGNSRFDVENIRSSLPNLKEGITPNLREISENVQLVNENPAKQLEVVMSVGEEDDRVDAKVEVTEQDPNRFTVTLDDTGTKETGRHRVGLAYQNANLLGGDEVLSLAYTTSPEVVFNVGGAKDVKVDVYSIGFRKPFYGIGDSLDIIYGNSNVSTPTSQSALGGTNTLVGKGEVVSLRWNHLFPRQGEYTSRLIFGFDYKRMNTRCTNPATGQDFETSPYATTLSASCIPYTLRPVSATYNGRLQGIGYMADYNFGLAYNLPVGLSYKIDGPPKTSASDNNRYSYISSRDVTDDFLILRFGGSYARLIEGWTLRAAYNAQLATSGLPPAEQFGLVGSTAVRGFNERALSSDAGHVINFEVYTPSFAQSVGLPGSLQALTFLDVGYGHNVNLYDSAGSFNYTNVASVGVGARYNLQKDVSFSIDVAKVFRHGFGDDDDWYRRNGWGGHFKLSLGF